MSASPSFFLLTLNLTNKKIIHRSENESLYFLVTPNSFLQTIRKEPLILKINEEKAQLTYFLLMAILREILRQIQAAAMNIFRLY